MQNKNVLKIAFALLLLIETSISTGQSVKKGFSAPESIASYYGRYFVSNIGPGSNQIGKDGDGFISEITASGDVKTLHFLPESGVLNAPRGMGIISNVIYVADVDRVTGFDIHTRKRVFELSLGNNAGLLNDLAVVDSSTIVVSDIFKNKIYNINVISHTFKIIGNIGGPNGLLYNSLTKLLYACSVGNKNNGRGNVFVKEGFTVKGNWRQLAGVPAGFFDGIQFLDPGNIIVSDWISMKSTHGKLIIYNLKKKKSISINCGATPADIFFDPSSQQLYIPETNKNQIIIINAEQIQKADLSDL